MDSDDYPTLAELLPVENTKHMPAAAAAVRRVWRMDSGDYPSLAQLILDAWQQRCSERQAAGLAALPRPQLMHSNISSVDDIRKVGWQ
jgi:hypothetical protein